MAESQAIDYPNRFAPGGATAQVYGLTNVMFALGFVAGPLGAGFVYQRLGWAATVLLLALVTVISSIPTMLWLGRARAKDGTAATAPAGEVVAAKDETLVILDQLSPDEIRAATQLIREIPTGQNIKFNCLTLREPLKAEYLAFRQGEGPRPDRRAFAILIDRHSPGGVIEAVINLTSRVIKEWKRVEDVMPILTPTNLGFIERVARSDPRVIQACRDIGIYNMSQVYFDAWAIGFDERWGRDQRLQQGLPYYRHEPGDNQYAHPLDFIVIADTETKEILSVDIHTVDGERTRPPLKQQNYLPTSLQHGYPYDTLKPIHITQPDGVSFQLHGNMLRWAGYKMHISFNYQEGIVLSDISIYDPVEKRQRPLFYRISVAEMVVPYGCPEPPHHRKQAFDIGEYGMGLMTNSLRLGCDCKGVIQYLDGVISDQQGTPIVVKNAICIHEEDNGLLIVTAANYDYGFYHIFTLDGTYKLEVKLTGILNTYCLHPSETANPYGTEVAHGVTAHNHQHIFSLRINPEIDGLENEVQECDAVPLQYTDDSKTNPYGNGFFCRQRAVDGTSLASLGRSWDIVNPTKVNPVCKKPVGYKILNSQYPGLLAQEGSVIQQRAAFATKPLWVVRFKDFRLYPAGNYVCQSTGEAHQSGNETLESWVSDAEPADIVCYVQFGLTHIPRTEDFPIMPVEPVSVTLRAANFFQSSPAIPFLSLPQNCDISSRLAGLGQSACGSRAVTVRKGTHHSPRLHRKLSL
ncbi:hypothetical protein CNMCM5878_003914 [Aspergillus fumigatiaffinis]|nr:hypothetical protein CNMCM5878_003914 [Aspergillus fumigatiaffinis]